MLTLLVYVFIALGLSFICSVMEAVLLSMTPVYAIQLEQKNPKAGKIYTELKKDIEAPLAAILSLNTIAHTIGAAGAGAQATKLFGDAYLGVISVILTLLILILSEILPKTLGAVFWKKIAVPMLPVLRFTMFSMKPLVFMSNMMTRILPKSKESNVINHDEFLILTQQGIKGGVFSEQESLILTNLFMLRKLTVKHIMTPRTVMFALREDTTVEEVLVRHPEIIFSRIPLYKTDLDDITGFVLRSDILLYAVRGMKTTPLSDFRRPITAVPESLSISRHFTGLIKDRAHISLVIDEYGGAAGIVTLEDVIETLIGIEIVDEHDKVKDLQNLARQQWSNRIRKMGLNPADYDFDR